MPERGTTKMSLDLVKWVHELNRIAEDSARIAKSLEPGTPLEETIPAILEVSDVYKRIYTLVEESRKLAEEALQHLERKMA